MSGPRKSDLHDRYGARGMIILVRSDYNTRPMLVGLEGEADSTGYIEASYINFMAQAYYAENISVIYLATEDRSNFLHLEALYR